MMLGRYTWRQLTRRPGRTLLTLAGIVIGVAGVVAISLTTNATRRAYRSMFDDLTGQAALEVVAVGDAGFAPSQVTQIAEIAGVKSTSPAIQRVAALLTAKGPEGIMVLGEPLASERTGASPHEFVEGADLSTENDVLLVKTLARNQKISLGDKVKLFTVTGATEFRVAGLIEPRGAANFNGGMVAFIPMATAQRLFQLGDRVTSVQIMLDDGVSAETIEPKIAATLPDGLSVQPPSTRGQLAQQSLIATEQGLSTLSAVSIVAGAFVILNAFLMSLGERRRQLAILRAIGVTRRQVTHLLLREAVVLGVMGMILGTALGVVSSIALSGQMADLVGVSLPDIELSWQPFALAVAFGPGMAVIASLIPTIRAAARPPLADLLGVPTLADAGARKVPLVAGLVLLVFTLTCVAALLGGFFPGSFVSWTPAPLMGMLLVSIILLSPAAFPYAARAVAALLRPVWGIEGRLAVRQLERNSNRTSLTGAVLCVALVVTIAMGQSIRNNIGDLEEWTKKTITADYLVRTTLPDLGFTINALLPEGMINDLKPLDGVRSVHPLNFFQTKVNGRQAIVLARAFEDDETATLDIAVGDRDSVVRGLLAGETVVGNALAQQLDVTVGDELEIKTRSGLKSLRIAGVVTEYIVGGMAIYIQRERARELFGFDGADVFMITAMPGEVDPLGKVLASFCDSRGLNLQSNAEFRARISQMVAGVVGFLWLLLGLVFVVASLGIVNTLTMNVLEQTREIAVLRTVAMRRRQIRLMILYQAASLGLASLAPGVGMGLILSYLMNLSTHALIGQPVEFTVSFWYIAGCCGACLVMALLAAWFPARRASRLEIIHALQYE